jgi:acetolactate synthase-1/2/3 large subunit
MDLSRPSLASARRRGWPGPNIERSGVRCAADFSSALEYALAMPGPHLIEAVLPEWLFGAKRLSLRHLLRAPQTLPALIAPMLKRNLAP